MRLAVALLLWAICGCAPLPAVSLRVRARYQHDQRRTVRTYEARVDCGWSLETRAARGAEPEASETGRDRRDSWLGAAPCTVPPACAWEASARERVLAAYAPEASRPTPGESP